MTKNRRTLRKRTITRRRPVTRRRPAARGMQRIRRVQWGARNIGGDKCYAKLRYVNAQTLTIPVASFATFQNQPLNVGAFDSNSVPDTTSLYEVMGDTPNLKTLAALYTRYRIRGIKIKLTFWQQGGVPVVLYTNAQSTDTNFSGTQEPSPAFVSPSISTLPEQRWAKYRVCGATAAGAKPTSMQAYYSVNKVFGPDAIVKNDVNFTGEMQLASPYWVPTATATSLNESGPRVGPWMQFGIFNMSGDASVAGSEPGGVLKIEQTVYTEFFGKRVTTS